MIFFFFILQFSDGCHFTEEESGYYSPGPASIDYCKAACLQSADCLGAVFANDACFFLSDNQTSSLAIGVPTELTGDYSFRRKECISGKWKRI